jgi:DNA-binding protein H-NS
MSENNVTKLTLEELSKTPLKDLLELQSRLGKAIEERRETERTELLNKINTLASNAGFTLSDLLSGKPAKKAPSKLKYRNPNNKDEGWTGKGRKPKWLADLLDAGGKIEDYEI